MRRGLDFMRTGEPVRYKRRKIRLIEGNAKCRHLKKCPLKGLCGRCLSVRGPGPHTPHPHTHCIRDTSSHREGGGGVEPEIGGEEQQFTKLGRKYQHD
jgi:hypothetical protein